MLVVKVTNNWSTHVHVVMLSVREWELPIQVWNRARRRATTSDLSTVVANFETCYFFWTKDPMEKGLTLSDDEVACKRHRVSNGKAKQNVVNKWLVVHRYNKQVRVRWKNPGLFLRYRTNSRKSFYLHVTCIRWCNSWRNFINSVIAELKKERPLTLHVTSSCTNYNISVNGENSNVSEWKAIKSYQRRCLSGQRQQRYGNDHQQPEHKNISRIIMTYTVHSTVI